jgi:hypothetical protein
MHRHPGARREIERRRRARAIRRDLGEPVGVGVPQEGALRPAAEGPRPGYAHAFDLELRAGRSIAARIPVMALP